MLVRPSELLEDILSMPAIVVPGAFFELPAHFRLGIALDTDVLQAGLERISAALDEIRG